MEISFLKALRDYPAAYMDQDYKATIKPLPIVDIVELENVYNNGNDFPLASREFLFLAGRDCYVFDYGFYDSIIEVQEFVREQLINQNLK